MKQPKLSQPSPCSSTASENQENQEEPFNFAFLPVELKHEVFKKLSTGYLEEVCSEVSLEWEGIVADIVNQRAKKVVETIPPRIRTFMSHQFLPETLEDPVKMLTLYERSMVWRKFDIRPILVNEDCLTVKRGIIYKAWKLRPCECTQLDDCIVRSIHLMSALDLFVVQSTRELQFFHLKDLEHLGPTDLKPENLKSYECSCAENLFEHGPGTDISVFKDQIIAGESPKTILLLKVASCNHEERSLKLERLRRIFLPIWCRSLCLLEDKFYVLYSTGYVGMWNRQDDELSISLTICGHGHRVQSSHFSKMYRLGRLVFIKTVPDDTCRWYVLDSDDDSMEIHIVQMAELVTAGFLKEAPSWECTEVFYIGMWYNCFIVHCQVQSLINGNAENRLMIKRIKRPPTLEDFKKHGAFSRQFLTECYEPCRSVKLNGSVISPFLPLSLKPSMLDPLVDQPIPVADMISVFWPSTIRRRLRTLKVYRIRISNLPLGFSSSVNV